MTPWGERLRQADPLRYESMPDGVATDRVRAAVLSPVTRPGRLTRRSLLAPITVAGVVLLAVAVGAGARFWRMVAPPVYAAVRFEVRLAEAAPGPGLREAAVGTEPRVIYLHDDVVVTNDDITAATVMATASADRFAVAVRLSPPGSERLRAATGGHVGRPVALVLDGLVVMAPTVRSAIGEVGLLSGDFDRAAAERIARGVTAR